MGQFNQALLGHSGRAPKAFSLHYPLTLSRDAVWLVIARALATISRKNAESLRSRLVRHHGSKTLTAKVLDFSPASFERAISGFSAQIRDASEAVLHEMLLCDFTTTTPIIRTASEVVLMDAYSRYFEYEMRIAVTGSVEDWERIRARIEALKTYGLGWWVSRLRTILDQFVQTALGRPDRKFWQAIYKPKKAYGDSSVTGWIADLFPYLDNPPKRRKNHIFEYQRKDWAIPVSKGLITKRLWGDDKGVPTGGFPSGFSSVPVRLSLPDGTVRSADLVGGFFAVQQTSELSLSPVIRRYRRAVAELTLRFRSRQNIFGHRGPSVSD